MIKSSYILKNHYWFVFAFGLSILGFVLSHYQNDHLYISVMFHLRLSLFYFIIAATSFWLSDIYYTKRKYILFGLSSLILIILGTLILTKLDYPKPFEDWESRVYHNLISLSLIIFIGYNLRHAKHFIARSEELKQLKSDRLEAEIKLLKQQLNPHFLFNTLNSIYYNSLTHSSHTPEMIMQLSEMLRYQLTTENLNEIKLTEELKFVDCYIYFERMRLRENVEFSYINSIEATELNIAPHVVITLIENSFKHFDTHSENGTISIQLTLHHRKITIETFNSYRKKETTSAGLGLRNLLRRLEILYPNRFEYNVKTNDFIYQSTLIIEL